MSEPNFPEAVLFDLDDTIIAHTHGTTDLWKDLCCKYAEILGTINGDALLSAVIETNQWYWSDPERHRIGRLNLKLTRRDLVRKAFLSLGIDEAEMAVPLADDFTDNRENLAFIFDGALDTLDFLKRKNIQMGMITNGASDMQRSKIERFQLERYFNVITVEGEFGKGKPDIEVFEHTLKLLGVQPDAAWMVGDDLTRDIAGGKNTGIFSIWVDWERKGLPENPVVQPDRIVNSISELI